MRRVTCLAEPSALKFQTETARSSHGCWSNRFHYFSATPSKVGNASSARIGYNLILARPMPPPSVGKASFMRGHFDHRTNCSSTKHKEGLRSLLAIGGSFDEAVC